MSIEAKNYEMPYGRYKGKRLCEIAQTDEGLLYLDWLVGVVAAGPVKKACMAFLDDNVLQDEIAELLNRMEEQDG